MSASTKVRPAPEVPEAARAWVHKAHRAGRDRAFKVSLVLLAGIAVVFCVTLSVGDYPIPIVHVIPAMFARAQPDENLIVYTLRLPRALTGLFVGLAFGASGAIFQSFARNPLASPDILGVTAGASTVAVFMITVLHGASAYLPFAAFMGGLITAFLIYILAYKRGVSSYRLVLVGIGVGAVASALTDYLLTKAQIADAASANVWLTGSLNSRGWESAVPIAISLAILAPATLALTSPLGVLQLGDDTAKGLGLGVERSRLILLIIGVALAGVGVAAAGPIAFVAFVSAPIARRLCRSPGPSLIPSALAGGLLVLLADLIARRAFAPSEIPVGIITGIIGAPYLLWLLARSNRIGQGG